MARVERQLRVRLTVFGSLAVSSASFWARFWNSSAVIRSATSSPTMAYSGSFIGAYQVAKYVDQLLSPPDLISALDDSAPGLSLRPSAAPLTTVGEPVSSVNLPAPFFDSIRRRYSRPPARFFAFSGTMKPSPAAISVQSTGSLAPSSSGVYVAVVRKSFG